MFEISHSALNNNAYITISGDVTINYIQEIKQKLPNPTSRTILDLQNVANYDFSFLQLIAYYIKILQNSGYDYSIKLNKKLKIDFNKLFPELENIEEVGNE